MTVSNSRPDHPGRTSPQLQRSLGGLLAGAACAAALAVGGLAASAGPSAAMQPSAESPSQMGDMQGHEGMEGRHHGRGRMKAHIQQMLTEVNATPQQRSKIEGIMKAAFDQIAPLHKKMEEGHRELHRLLSQPTIDRNALERVRAARISDLDQASKIMVKALADSAEVLTPEQRSKLAQLEEQRRSARRAHGRRGA